MIAFCCQALTKRLWKFNLHCRISHSILRSHHLTLQMYSYRKYGHSWPAAIFTLASIRRQRLLSSRVLSPSCRTGFSFTLPTSPVTKRSSWPYISFCRTFCRTNSPWHLYTTSGEDCHAFSTPWSKALNLSSSEKKSRKSFDSEAMTYF